MELDRNDRRTRLVPRGWRDIFRVDRLLLIGLLAVILSIPLLDQGGSPGAWPCSPQPTAVLPFDPADGTRLAARATDIFVGRVVAGAAGPPPASPVPGALSDVPVRHLLVEVIEAQKGTATGTVVVHQALQPGAEGCHRGVLGDYPLWTGDVRLFVATRDEPTGTYSLFAGPYSHPSDDAPLGAARPQSTHAATAAP